MASFLHIDLISADLAELSATLPSHTFIGASLGGTALSDFKKPDKMVLFIGNEGKGLSEALLNKCQAQITIPKGPSSKIESLNAAVSGGILLSHLL